MVDVCKTAAMVLVVAGKMQAEEARAGTRASNHSLGIFDRVIRHGEWRSGTWRCVGRCRGRPPREVSIPSKGRLD